MKTMNQTQKLCLAAIMCAVAVPSEIILGALSRSGALKKVMGEG